MLLIALQQTKHIYQKADNTCSIHVNYAEGK